MHELARCLVVGPGGTSHTGFVEDFEGGVLRVKIPDSVTSLDGGVAVELRVLDEVKGEVHYTATVREVIGGLVEFIGLHQLSVRQRRGAARVRVNVPTKAAVALDDDEIYEIPITILDISATGVRILCKEQMHIDRDFSFDFPTDDTVLSLTGHVVWSEESVSGWRYGCRLLRSGPREVELLFRFVLLTQGAQRRQMVERSVSAG